ncbi:MAG TPA: efflux RND transporter periplasmic adaptor subunit [Syntrophorhabdaceae bacterium]|nr:efflux RND transporter periplasmic adaptor subunit [Syntrophorhabdaceae bacterium]
MRKSALALTGLHLLFIVVLVLPVVGCKKKAPEEKVVNVIVQTAESKKLRPFIESTGTLNPNEEIIMGAEIDGIVKSVKVNEGTIVSKGMLLATLDDTEFSHEVIRARAALKQTEASLANTKMEFSRKDALYKEQLVTRQQYDDVFTRLTLAESEVERARAALVIANQKLAKTRLIAPVASRVKEKKVSVGDFVKNGTQMLILIQPNPLKLRFTVPERDIGKIKAGQDVNVKVDAFPGREFIGKVSIVFPSLEEKTRSLTVEAIIPNNEDQLKPGLFARVILYTGEPQDMVVVPVTSLLYEGEKVRLFVVEGNVAKEHPVKLGNKYGELMEIQEGLRAGETVVTAGQQSLSEGAKVASQRSAREENGKPGTKDNR